MFVVIMILSAFTMLNFGTQAAFAPSPTSENQSFAHPMTVYYHAYFVESGLPSGTSWSVTYDGTLYSSTTTTIEITLTTSGTYSYSIPFADSGSYSYPPYPSSGTLSDTGTLDVGFGANTSAKETTTDANLKDWFYSTLADTTVLSQDYGIALWINGANVTTGTTNASNDYTAAFSHVFSTSGTDSAYFVWYAITGGLPSSPYDFATPTITVTINSDPTVTASASQTTVDVGQLFTLSSSVSSGTSAYTYQWYSGTAAISGATSSSYSTSESTSGSYTFYVNVTDSVTYKVKSNVLTITVDSALTATIAASTSTIDYGQSVTFTASASGGSGSYSYQWYLNGSAVSGATSSTWTTTTLPTGSPTIYVKVTDSDLNTVQSNTLTETVNQPLAVTISSSQNPIDFGVWVTFNTTVTGGTSPYTYQWSLNRQNVSGATNSTWSTNSLLVGTNVIGVVVTDSSGDPAHDRGVNASQPTVILTSIPDNSPIYPGDPFSLSVSLVGVQFVWNGNFSAYSFQWFVNNKIIPGATNSSITAFQDTPGTYDYKVRIIANAGHGAMYKGAFFGRAIVVVTDNLQKNTVKFVESGLPVGSYWSAAFIVLSKNTSYPYGTMFQDPLGFIFKVTGSGLPAIVISVPNGTWTFYVQSDVYNNTTHSFETNASGYISSSYVANVSQGTVTMPSNSANGSIIIHIGFALAGDPPSNGPSNLTNITAISTASNNTITNSTLKSSIPNTTILPIARQNSSIPPVITKTIPRQISRPAFSVVSFIFLSLVAICLILSALGIQWSSRKKQKDREAKR
jgi:hypothetical protein